MSTEAVAESIPPGYNQTEVGVIPEDWEVKKIGDLVDSLEAGVSVNSVETEKDIYAHESSILKTSSVIGGKFIPEEQKTIVPQEIHRAKLNPLKNSIIISRMNTKELVGECGYVSKDYPNIFLPDRLWMTRHKSQVPHCVLWLAYLLSSHSFNRAIKDSATGTSGTMKNISKDSILAVHIPFPPTLAEQEAIATALSDTDALIESLEQLIAKKRQVKQGAMQELLTGKRRLPGFSGEWQTKLLGDLFEFSGGLSASREQLSTEGYCYLHYGDIHTSDKTYVDVKLEIQDIPKLNIPLKKVSFTSLLESGDVVFVDASEDDEGASKHVVVFNDDKIPFISGLHTIVAKSKTNELDYHYRRYCFQTRDVKQQFRFFAVGTKVTGISKANITKIILPVPPLSEQTAIAAIISDMDAEITALEEKLAKTRQLKQGMMQELLTGRIRLV